MEEKNAIITSAKLFIEDHGILTAYINLDYGGSGQGFGGYSLGGPYCSVFVRRTLEVVGVYGWDELAGNAVRARIENGLVRELGNVIKDQWFNPKEEFEAMKVSA